MRAIKRGTDAMLADPAKAWKQYCNLKVSAQPFGSYVYTQCSSTLSILDLLQPAMKSSLCGLQYERSFNYMSQDHSNVLRDWKKVSFIHLSLAGLAHADQPIWTQVTAYAQRLGVVPDDFKMNMTNQYLSWPLQDSEAVDGAKEQ